MSDNGFDQMYDHVHERVAAYVRGSQDGERDAPVNNAILREQLRRLEERNDELTRALRLASVRLGICAGRMRACHEETGNHELLAEIEMFEAEAKTALEGDKPMAACQHDSAEALKRLELLERLAAGNVGTGGCYCPDCGDIMATVAWPAAPVIANRAARPAGEGESP